MKLTLPFPPSVNGYWRSFRGRQIISAKGREYRSAVVEYVGECEPVGGEVVVSIVLHPPDRRRRDVDNYAKATLDALTHAGVWDDDNQVSKLTIERGDVRPRNGAAVVSIERRADA